MPKPPWPSRSRARRRSNVRAKRIALGVKSSPINTTLTLPIVRFDRAYHYGTFDIAHKRKASYEGACLSASHCPQAWKRIAKLGGLPLFELDTASLRFLDLYAIREGAKAVLLGLAVELGLLQRVTMWRYRYYDDEYERWYIREFTDRAEVQEEAAPMHARVRSRAGYRTTRRLTRLSGHRAEDGDLAETFGLMALAQLCGLHGAWWNDPLDDARGRAPAVGLFASTIAHIKRRHVPDQRPPRVAISKGSIEVAVSTRRRHVVFTPS